jgi:hypothetical protein
MKLLRLAVTESERPLLMFMDGDELPFEIFHVEDLGESIYQISATLSTVIQGVRCGLALPEMIIQFCHRAGPGCLALYVNQTIPGSDAVVEFREFPSATAWGGLGPKSEGRLIHETVLTPAGLSNSLRGFLTELVQPRLAELYRTDRVLLTEVLKTICLHDAEGRALGWFQHEDDAQTDDSHDESAAPNHFFGLRPGTSASRFSINPDEE